MRYFFLLLLLCNVVCAEGFFNKTENFKRAHVGICVVECETGEEVYSCNAQQFFVPASLQKIVTSAAAIALLGDDFCFQTDFGYEGKIDQEGILHGNVWIRGGGDPTLPLTVFSKWEEILKKERINKVDGKILVDASCFETALASPYWYFQDLGNYYGAGACSLTINQNLYHVTFQPGKKEGDPATVLKIEPKIPNLLIQNEVTTGPAGSGDQVYIFGSEYSPIQFYRGTVPIDQPSFTVKGAIPDPAAFCAATLHNKLNTTQGYEIVKNGIKPEGTILMRLQSPPLKEILKETNQESVNLFAEHLLKIIGDGMAQKGTAKITHFLKNLGISAEVRDGAGLARTNYLTPKGFVTLLSQIKKNPTYHTVYDSFPEVGKNGTVKDFPLIPKASIRAKSGSMTHIYNLGGYLTLESGKEYVFCVICNNYPGALKEIKQEIHRFLTHLVKKLA